MEKSNKDSNADVSYFEVINKRFSCRSFLDKKITKEELNCILEAGRVSPTAVNYQPVMVYVIEDESLLERMKEATRFTFDAKTILVVCHDNTKSWHRKRDNKDHGIIDSTIAATQMMLAATALGLGTTYVCSFNNQLLTTILDIPSEYEINCLLPLGYPSSINPHGPRKDLEDFVIYK